AYQQSLDIRKELGQPALRTEPMAGLIRVALATNDISLASNLMEELMHYFSDGGMLEGTEEPLRVYLACYEVLEKLNDPRSVTILRDAMQVLEEQTAKINDEQSRRMFIENVPWRRAIQRAWFISKGNT
ncbi:MAG TPA: hypothetical protein VFZ43_05135, partial [Anaerolineales bacterium]